MKFRKQCHKILKECLNVNENDKVLIVYDKKTKWLADDLLKTASEICNANAFEIPISDVNGVEPSETASKNMLNYTVVLAPTTKSITHTKAVKNAVENGIRVATLPGINKKIMEQSMLADYNEIEKISLRLYNKIKGSDKILVKTTNGTNFSFSVKGREWHTDTGKIKKCGNLPAGEVFIAPLESTANGVIVVDKFENDGEIFAKIGTKITVKNGKAVDVSDKRSKIAKLFGKIENGTNVAEFAIGTNSKAKLIGNILQDEKALGTCHIAFGSNFTFGGTIKAGMHLDTVLRNPTIIVDGKVIMEEGKFT